MRSNVDPWQLARNCLAYMLEFIVMQMSKDNREKGYSFGFNCKKIHSIGSKTLVISLSTVYVSSLNVKLEQKYKDKHLFYIISHKCL